MIRALCLALLLASCSPAPVPPPIAVRGPEMPTGTGPVQYEPGMTRLCQQQPHQGNCP